MMFQFSKEKVLKALKSVVDCLEESGFDLGSPVLSTLTRCHHMKYTLEHLSEDCLAIFLSEDEYLILEDYL